MLSFRAVPHDLGIELSKKRTPNWAAGEGSHSPYISVNVYTFRSCKKLLGDWHGASLNSVCYRFRAGPPGSGEGRRNKWGSHDLLNIQDNIKINIVWVLFK
jgi:hypothetical protein